MIPNKDIIKEIAIEVEKEYQMGGLSDGLYFDYAYDILSRYLLKESDKPTSNCTLVGENAGKNLTKGEYVAVIGNNSGTELTNEKGLVIIGDDIDDLDPSTTTDKIYIGDRVVIGETVLGKPCNLYDILKEAYINGKIN